MKYIAYSSFLIRIATRLLRTIERYFLGPGLDSRFSYYFVDEDIEPQPNTMILVAPAFFIRDMTCAFTLAVMPETLEDIAPMLKSLCFDLSNPSVTLVYPSLLPSRFELERPGYSDD